MDACLGTLAATAQLILKFEINLKKTPREKRTPAFLISRGQVLTQYWDQYLSTYLRFLQLPGAAQSPYVTEDTFSDVEECYLDSRAVIVSWTPQPPPPTVAPAPQEPAAPAAPLLGKLPKLEIPQFSGELREWETFRDLFRAMVHDYPGLSAAVKLQYLKSNVTGDAAQLIRNFAVSNANYDAAWQLLVERFDNPRILVQSHVRALHSIPAVGKESAAGIKKLLDATNECVRALQNLRQPVQHWDVILVDLTTQRLDPVTRRDWETSLGNAREFPTWAQLSTFLETRTRALEAAHPPTTTSNLNNTSASTNQKKQKTPMSTHTASTSQPEGGKSENGKRSGRKCALCSEQHYVGACPQYKALDLPQREEQFRRLRLCRNCLGNGHLAAACPSTKRCNSCGANHHTSLHSAGRAAASAPRAESSAQATPEVAPATIVNQASSYASRSRSMLIGTAQVTLMSTSGRHVPARVLIDPCSEGCLATEAIAQALRVARTPVIVPVAGVAGAKAGVSKSAVTIVVCSRLDPSKKISVDACVLPRVTVDLPSRVPDSTEWSHISGLELADPEFKTPGRIDMILGAEVYREVLLRGMHYGPPGVPLAQETIFGWILTGPTTVMPSPSNEAPRGLRVHHCTTAPDLSAFVRRFWEIEELPTTRHLTEDEQRCETLFRETHRRDESGRYVVRLPLRTDPAGSLGDSRDFACRALVRGERRRENDPDIKSEYSKFLSEYLALGHMTPAPGVANAGVGAPRYYMPHHAVVREVGGKKKLRVVFNASHPSSSGQSLNDLLSPGPKLQADITSVLMRWRRHRIVFAADIVKMFRQIKVHPDDCDLQRIVWRESPDKPIQDMKLLTVTYGTACAPYLAIRTLQQLAQDEAHRFPSAALAVQRDTYVDDTLTGADDLATAQQLKTALTQLLRSGGFELSKWTSNSPELLVDHHGLPTTCLPVRSFEPDEWIRTLGVVWRPSDDSFSVKLNLNLHDSSATKRTLLSELARTYDPLGWVAPVLVRAKILFQDSWAAGVAWDETLPEETLAAWLQLRAALPALEDLAIPRWLGPSARPRRYQLHGFSDASERAYSAAVYVRTTDGDGPTSVSLLVAKTKVAPLKSVSLPRLELCGAVLLARLMSSVVSALQDDLDEETFAWSDSTVTLAWLRGHPSRWVPFVANRVSEVHSLLPTSTWQHVKSQDNPADLATRGIPPRQLLDAQIWWQGPAWLQRPPSAWPRRAATSPPSTDLDMRVERQVHAACSLPQNEVLERFSRLTRLLRVSAWCLRLRQRSNPDRAAHLRDLRPLCATEINSARQRWIIITQMEAFPDAIAALRKGKAMPSRSPLRRLNPFLDDAGVLRLGGRLQHAILSYGERHPAILPGSSKFTELLIRHAHEVTLHGGPQLTMSHLLRFCWILGGRNRVRALVHRCVKCTRHRAAAPRQLMGQLPPSRSKPSRPFEKTGLDYAGPFLLRASSGRGRTTVKAYIALFVCLSSRAVHLEVVGNYSTDAFIAAFKRFTARRGICAEIHSDNGTNFIGADRELRSMFLSASAASQEIAAALANDGTQWHFIPPHAPHFGGIWEAGVKATKHHLRRVIGETSLTYEEFSTVVTQIEGCLNSRPLGPLSSDPADLVALTPGHLLIGGAPTTPPEPSLSHLPVGRLGRWQLTTHMLESFWRRWSSEYLHHLQQRSKWTEPTRNFVIGDLVLIRDDLRPPAKWPLARVIETHPGPDGLTRVVTVKTAASTYRRPIVKLVLLPVREPIEPPGAPNVNVTAT